MDYKIYVCDTETTGLSPENDIIELSLKDYNSDRIKTWLIKPLNINKIDLGALKVNGHKYEDITHQTLIGKSKYLDPKSVIIDIENWLSEDMCSSEDRIMLGHNVLFDRKMMEILWNKCESFETFPFGRKMLDTMQIQFFMDFCFNQIQDSYSLNALNKKYGIKNDKAHTAESDTLATAELFKKQLQKYSELK